MLDLNVNESIRSIGALDNTGLLTELGRKMMLVPLEPRLAQMLLSTAENYRVFLPEMVVVVACIAVGNLFVRFGGDDQVFIIFVLFEKCVFRKI